MTQYTPMQNYAQYQPNMMQQPYPDRLAQLQNQYQNIVQPQAMPPQTNQGLLWVQGEAGAKSYLVAPGVTVLLMDSEGQRFYLKSTDASGIPSLRTFEYSEVHQNTSQRPVEPLNDMDSRFVTREEYEGLKRQYDSIAERINSIVDTTESGQTTRPAKPRGRGGNTDEQSDF